MPSIPLFSKIALIKATPAALGEIALNATGQLQVHNGTTVDTYATTVNPTLSNATLTGSPTSSALLPAGTSTAALATTQFVTTAANLKADLASPQFTGNPIAPTCSVGNATQQLATTKFVYDTNNASPAFAGTPTAPTAAPGTNTTQLATTAFATTADNLKANLASPALTGVPTAPTAAAANNSTQLATTAYTDAADNLKANLAGATFSGPVTVNAALTSPQVILQHSVPAAIGGLAIDGNARLQVYNGTSVDPYVPMMVGHITAIPDSTVDIGNPVGLTVQDNVTSRTYNAYLAIPIPLVVGTSVLFVMLDTVTAFIIGQGDNSIQIGGVVTDWNTAISNGVYQGTLNAQTNSPNNAMWWVGHVEVHSAAYVVQTVTNFTYPNISRVIWERAMINSAWQPWRVVCGSDMPLTLIGAGGSSFGANVAAYPSTYSVPAMQKQAGIVKLIGMFNTSAAIGSSAAVCTLPTSLLPVFTSGRTSMMIGEATSSPAGLALRFSIDSTGKVAYNALVGGNTIGSGNNFMMNFTWLAAT